MKKMTNAQINKVAEEYIDILRKDAEKLSIKPMEDRIMRMYTAGLTRGMKLMLEELNET